MGKAHQTMTRNMQANGGNLAMAFRKGLCEAVPELSARLLELYAQLDGASDERTQDELVAEVARRVTSFVNSSLAGQRGSHVAAAAHEAANAISKVEMGIRNSFKLAVHEQETSMSFFSNEVITLVKPDGSERKAEASVQPGTIFVLDKTFPVAAGDEIRHVLPSGVEQRFEVLDPGFIGGHYEIKARNAATPRRASAAAIVHNHYNNSGIANVMGPDGVASGNTNNMQITQQTLNLEDPRIADELAELRKALAAETDDDDATIDAGNVASAQKRSRPATRGVSGLQ